MIVNNREGVAVNRRPHLFILQEIMGETKLYLTDVFKRFEMLPNESLE
jgi:hypothetical protein